MNTKTMNGKLIAWVQFPDKAQSSITASDDIGLHMSATYHGDHDQFWIVESDKYGNEVGRINPRYVDSFAWVEPIPTEDQS